MFLIDKYLILAIFVKLELVKKNRHLYVYFFSIYLIFIQNKLLFFV